MPSPIVFTSKIVRVVYFKDGRESIYTGQFQGRNEVSVLDAARAFVEKYKRPAFIRDARIEPDPTRTS